MRIQLVDRWRSAWRWFSTQAMFLAGVIQLAWVAVPDDLKGGISPKLTATLTIVLLVLGIVGRLVDQPVTQTDTATK